MKKNIVLIGMPGCGKTTIGRMISQELGMAFCDVDKYIEDSEGKNIEELFLQGESYFRDIESKIIIEVVLKKATIISTGGGVVKRYENMKVLKENGIIIFINRPIGLIVSDIDISNRPLLKDKKEKIYKLYKDRLPLYKKYADYEILNEKAIETVIEQVKIIID